MKGEKEGGRGRIEGEKGTEGRGEDRKKGRFFHILLTVSVFVL
jgi:hypothetical protein